jgi:Transcription factor WhiB
VALKPGATVTAEELRDYVKGQAMKAKAICAACQVRRECLAFAVSGQRVTGGSCPGGAGRGG